jgi:phosphoribosylformylglycinamidine synthase
VICGPGENAGVVDIGDGQAVVFKMESHNHPSFIEPYQGAATGVGGILRDVFTMGARPIASMNALRFGDPAHPRTRHLVAGVVAGIGGYGNCVGVPTVGGECGFDPGYNENILVNAMTVGLAAADRIFYSAAAGIGNAVVYVGSKTGRDGIHGATMASAEFDAATEEKRPTVQVGDPFTEKLLIEACLELMASDAIVAIQDMGAAGLTSSAFEMAAKGKVGIELDLDRVPTREPSMTAYEIMLSESQERMLMVLRPEQSEAAAKIFAKWDLDFAVIGEVTGSGRLVLRQQDKVVADLPVGELSAATPEYDRPIRHAEVRPPLEPASLTADEPLERNLLRLIGSPELASKRWIWEQYDHMVMADTIQRPGGDAAVVRVHGTRKALAMSLDCTPRYCAADPEMGAAQALAEVWRNLTATGATPLAFTDCLNFGNPERPEIMGAFASAVEGLRRAALALDFPVVSGNVSLYNETQGRGIPPTPQIGGVGLITDLTSMANIAPKPGDSLVLLGETRGHLGQSLYLAKCLGRAEGPPPPVDLAAERRHGDFVRAEITSGTLRSCHDLSDGGLLIGVAEMCLASHTGAQFRLPNNEIPAMAAFGEDQGRYLAALDPAAVAGFLDRAKAAEVPAVELGKFGGGDLTLEGFFSISLNTIRSAHEGWLPGYMDDP